MSESHLNCLGLAFFLTSVKAFNKTNKFFILDDVISSFDSNHRMRFANLLIEKFSDYQIILLTHEKEWFDLVNNIVKGRNWLVNTIRSNKEKGPEIDISTNSLKEKIESQISNGDPDGLGNNIRKYLEGFLKDIALNLSVKVDFQYNDKNENRMANELLNSLKSHLKKNADKSFDHSSIDRLLSSTFISNKDSHDSSFNVSLGDCKALWADVLELRRLFYCDSCDKYVSKSNYDKSNKKITCSCEKLDISWK